VAKLHDRYDDDDDDDDDDKNVFNNSEVHSSVCHALSSTGACILLNIWG
jgi:hypothetical protein